MRKFVILFLLISLAISVSAQGRKGLAILEFKESGNVSPDAGSTIADLITNRINPTEYFIVERSQLSKVMKEKLFSAGDSITEEDARNLRLLGVTFVMLGNISKIENYYYGGYRIVDVNTARIGKRDSVVAARDFKEFVEKTYRSLANMGDFLVIKKDMLGEFLQELENSKVRAWTATRTRYLAFDNNLSGWQDIPGLTLRIYLPKKSLVYLTASGPQRAKHTLAIAGYRFVIDNRPRGDKDWGLGIHHNNHTVCWNLWTANDAVQLSKGWHTIKVQARGQNAIICGEVGNRTTPYTSGLLRVIVFPGSN